MSIRCGHCRERHESVAEVRACGIPRPAQKAQEAPLEPGFYRSGPKVFRLLEDSSWALLMSNGRFSGPARPPYRPERMTVEEVAAEGRRVVRCIVCGIRLHKPESIERGIGPVCASKV
jgi:hypothetical protein